MVKIELGKEGMRLNPRDDGKHVAYAYSPLQYIATKYINIMVFLMED
jgi:hypothetical protein